MARKSAADRFLEEENRREITGLKDGLAVLSTTVAIGTEATNGLKEAVNGLRVAVEKEFKHHSEDGKELQSRISFAETQIHQIREEMAQSKSINDTLERQEKSMMECSSRLGKIEAWIDKSSGISTGVRWAFGVTAVVALPCVGYVLNLVISKVIH